MDRIKELDFGTIAFNIGIVLLICVLIWRMTDRGEGTIKQPQFLETTLIEKVCIEGEWDECWDFPGGELVKIYVVEPEPNSNTKILYVTPTRN